MFDFTSAKIYGFLKKFMPHTEAIITEIVAAYDARDAQPVSFFAHKLKSSARTVGANGIADVCEALEIVGRDSDWIAIDELNQELAPAMQRVKDFIDTQ